MFYLSLMPTKRMRNKAEMFSLSCTDKRSMSVMNTNIQGPKAETFSLIVTPLMKRGSYDFIICFVGIVMLVFLLAERLCNKQHGFDHQRIGTGATSSAAMQTTETGQRAGSFGRQ